MSGSIARVGRKKSALLIFDLLSLEAMSDYFGFRQGQPARWYSRYEEKSNAWCLYCGVYVGPGSQVTSDKEHLVGRRFVPSGTLGGDAFNFIFRACQKCNSEKAAAERHVSSVTLFSSLGRSANTEIDAIATHKASRDFHPDGGLVRDAWARHRIEAPFFGGKSTFELIGPPRLDHEAVHLLATRQIQGLFSLVTTRDPRLPEKMRLLPPSQVRFLGYYLHTDWGNPQVREVARRVAGWDCHVGISTADGFFKAILKRSATASDGWFWALEWNKAVRVVGAICNPENTPAWLHELPELEWEYLPGWRHRRETPLRPDEDCLFSFEDEVPDQR